MFKKLLKLVGRKLKKLKIKFLFYLKILFSIKENKIVNIFILNSILIIKLFTSKM